MIASSVAPATKGGSIVDKSNGRWLVRVFCRRDEHGKMVFHNVSARSIEDAESLRVALLRYCKDTGMCRGEGKIDRFALVPYRPESPIKPRRPSLLRKDRQLGMPFGTACNRLRKAVMHELVRRLGLDRCLKCGESIETPEDLSLDHRRPWLGVSPDLFWDVNNIAFSHIRCNLPDRPELQRSLYNKGPGIRFTGEATPSKAAK